MKNNLFHWNETIQKMNKENSMLKLKCEYTCKICGENILDEPDILDEHLITHKIPIELFWQSENYDSESIYNFFFER